MAELEEKLSEKTKEAEEHKEKLLRLAAEFENYKRLALRDQREHVRFANERLIKELLPVLDNLERAIQSCKASSEGAALLQGVELTLKQALETLGKFEVQQMNTVGKPFDPAFHQAVAQVESDQVPENCVVQEFQRGYFLDDRVLRAAMVSVSAPSAGGGAGQQADEPGQDQETKPSPE